MHQERYSTSRKQSPCKCPHARRPLKRLNCTPRKNNKKSCPLQRFKNRCVKRSDCEFHWKRRINTTLNGMDSPQATWSCVLREARTFTNRYLCQLRDRRHSVMAGSATPVLCGTWWEQRNLKTETLLFGKFTTIYLLLLTSSRIFAIWLLTQRCVFHIPRTSRVHLCRSILFHTLSTYAQKVHPHCPARSRVASASPKTFPKIGMWPTNWLEKSQCTKWCTLKIKKMKNTLGKWVLEHLRNSPCILEIPWEIPNS